MKIKTTGNNEYGRFIKALIVGSPGAGKTLTASTWKNPVYANAEDGLMSIADRHVRYVDIKSRADTRDLLKSLVLEENERTEVFNGPVETIVVDTIDAVQRFLIRERLKETKKEALVIQDWGWLGDQMKAITNAFKSLPMNVVFLCHAKDTVDDDGRLLVDPALQGAIGSEIPGYVDLALWLRGRQVSVPEGEKIVRKTERYLQTVQDNQARWVKDRSGKLPPEIAITFDDDYDRIHHFIFSGIAELPQSESFDWEPPAPSAPEIPIVAPRSTPRASSQKKTPAPAPVLETRRDDSGQPQNVDETTGEVKVSRLHVVREKQEEEPVKVPEPEADKPSTDEPLCSKCGEALTRDQADISRIRTRTLLCKPHLTEWKASQGESK